MPVLPRSFFSILLLALTLGGPITAWAEGPRAERASVRLRYGLALREGVQEATPAVNYGGVTPNDVGLWAAVFGDKGWGAWASVQREGFSLSKDAATVTGGSLLRASVGPSAWMWLGPVRAELSAGYGFAQLPAFTRTDEGQVRLVPVARHAALVGARVLVPLPWKELRVEARGEVPVALGSTSGGFAAGGALLIPLVRRDAWGGTLVLDYQYVRDSLTTAEGLKAGQVISRAGAAFELSFGGAGLAREQVEALPPAGDVAKAQPEAAPEPQTGSLRVSVMDARSGTPVQGATILVGSTELHTDTTGLARLEGLAPGPVEVKVSVKGFRDETEAVVIAAGTETPLVLAVTSMHQSVFATVSGQVRSVRLGRPLQATLVIPEAKLRRRTDERGTFQVQLKQGRYRLVFSAPGHLSQTKTVTVHEGEQAIFNVDLFPLSR